MRNKKWLDIKGYEGLYKISDHGDIYTFYKNKVMKPCSNGYGYLNIFLVKDMNRKPFYIHRLVASHFIKNPDNKKFVNHADFNKENNCAENLEWVTPKENSHHAWINGATKKPPTLTGEDNFSSKLKILQVQAIRYLYPKFTVKEISIILKMSWSTIDKVVKNETWKEVNSK